MMSSPFISVIIDNYNYARFLSEAINSVLQQKKYTNYEIIVVDDASTDHSKEIMESYGDKIIPVYLSENRGQGHAFNAGFEVSKGEWICFLDADDLFLEDKLLRIAEKAVANPDSLLIYHQGYYVSKDLVPSFIFPERLPEGYLAPRLFKTSETLLPPTSFLCFKRDFLKQVLPLDPFLTKIDADFPLQIWACSMGKVAAIKEPLGLYRLHGNNWFSNKDFLLLDLNTLTHLMRRTERGFYSANTRAKTLNFPPLSLFKNRFYRRNLFIFGYIGWFQFLYYFLRG